VVAAIPRPIRRTPCAPGRADGSGGVERRSYHVELGSGRPTIDVEYTVVRTGGYRSQRADTVDLIASVQRITLLVVPPGDASEIAQRALKAAGHPGEYRRHPGAAHLPRRAGRRGHGGAALGA
jgi:hypothetical protein